MSDNLNSAPGKPPSQLAALFGGRQLALNASLVASDDSHSDAMSDDDDKDDQNATFDGLMGGQKGQARRSTAKRKASRTRQDEKNMQTEDPDDMDVIDEEEFVDYALNPLRRKEYDRVRLQQQMREIKNIQTFFGRQQESFPEFKAIVFDPETMGAYRKNYAVKALCCLSVTNPVRSRLIRIVVISPWFDRLVLTVVCLNCIVIALDQPSKEEMRHDRNLYDRVWYFLQNNGDDVDDGFLIFYTIEMCLKIIAMGFFSRPFSYLRDPWNVLDFSLVVLGWISNIFQNENITPLRIVKLLRPLRTINSMPGMSGLVATILNSAPAMLNVLFLFVFMLILFSTISCQLLMGLLQYRCEVVATACSDGDITTICVDEEKDQLEENSIYCPSMTDAECVSRLPNMKSDLTCIQKDSPIGNTLSFDNLIISIFNVFQTITLEGWTDQMYAIRNATNGDSYDILFVAIVVFGAFFVLNLMIAVQFAFLGEAFDEDERVRKIIKRKIEQRKKALFQEGLTFTEKSDKKVCDVILDDDAHSKMDLNESIEIESGKNIFTNCKPLWCVKLSNKSEKLVNSNLFNRLILIIIVLNTIVLATEYYDQPDWMIKMSYDANIVFTAIFTLEMLLKLFGLGLKQYVTDSFNIFDSIVVILSLIDLMVDPEQVPGNTKVKDSSGVSVFRAFRLLRIFKILKSWSSLRVLLITVLQSLPAISNIFFLTFLFIFIFSLLAKQLYDYQLYDSGSHQLSQYGFQTTLQSLQTMFIVLTGENWNEVMIEVIIANAVTEQRQSETSEIIGPFLFFFIIMMLGNYILLNLFLAVLLKFISDNSTLEKLEYEAKQEFRAEVSDKNLFLMVGIQNKMIKSLQNLGKDEVEDRKKSFKDEKQKREFEEYVKIQQLKEISKKKNTEIRQNSVSLYLFTHDNRFRVFLKGILDHPYFENFILYLIALNSLMLYLQEPVLTDEYQNQSIDFILNVISILFCIEACIKIIVMGFYIGQKTYLKDGWNVLDFSMVIIQIVTWILALLNLGQLNKTFRVIRCLRALRPLRFVNKNEGIKTVVNALFLSIPSLLNVLLIIFLFILIFGILGVQLWKGGQSYCTDSEVLEKAACEGSYEDIDWYNTTIAGKPISIVLSKTEKTREWMPFDNNYNNIFNSTETFFEVSTLEMWPDIMFRAIDYYAEDHTPVRNSSPEYALIFVVYIFLTTFFIMNLFISVIVDKFTIEIKKRQGAEDFTDEQKEWVKIQRILIHTKPKIIPVEPANCLRNFFYKIVQSRAFEYFIMLVILLNTITISADYWRTPYNAFLNYCNSVFLVIFTIEMILKIIAYKFKYYWHVHWNKFDMTIVIVSLLSSPYVTLQVAEALRFNTANIKASSDYQYASVVRIIRISRLLKMIRTFKGLRAMLKTLYLSLPNLANTSMLLFLIFFVFTIAGMSLFGQMNFGDFITKNANFTTFHRGFMTLFRSATGESWNGIMHECLNQEGSIATYYWITYMLVTFFIFMNIFIAVIYENFKDVHQSSDDESDITSLKKLDIKNFQNTWAEFNPEGQHYMQTLLITDFLKALPPPLGFNGINVEDKVLNKYIYCLNIKDHNGRIYYPEVMFSIFHSVVGINDERVKECQQVKHILKMMQYKYREGLSKKLDLDSLCGNKYYRTEITASKMLSAKALFPHLWANHLKRKEEKILEEKRKLKEQEEQEELNKLKETHNIIQPDELFKEKKRKKKKKHSSSRHKSKSEMEDSGLAQNSKRRQHRDLQEGLMDNDGDE